MDSSTKLNVAELMQQWFSEAVRKNELPQILITTSGPGQFTVYKIPFAFDKPGTLVKYLEMIVAELKRLEA